nr:monocarboxylate transporter 13-like [Pogona vitticeps]
MSPQIYSEPPDGGWGWMIALAAFIQLALSFGVVRSFGVFFVEFLTYFEEPSSATSWVSSITVAVLMFSSPLASALGTQYGERPVAMVGGVFSTCGYLLASFATSLVQLCLFIGVLTGLGGALLYSPSMSLVTRYFNRRRAMAHFVVFSGAGIASLAFPPLFQFLVDSYGWRGGLLVLSGISSHLVVCGALLRPLNVAATGAVPSPEEESRGKRLASLLGLKLLCHWDFMVFSGAGFLMALGYFIPVAHLLPHARETGFDEYQAAFLVSAVGVADIVGRILGGWLASCTSLTLIHQLTLWTLLTGISLLAIPLARSYGVMLAVSICYGFLGSSILPLRFSSLADIVGPDKIMGAIGLLQVMASSGALAGPPFSGWIRDVTGSYDASFFTSGSFFIAGSLTHFLLHDFFSCRHPRIAPKHPEGRQAEEMQDLSPA